MKARNFVAKNANIHKAAVHRDKKKHKTRQELKAETKAHVKGVDGNVDPFLFPVYSVFTFKVGEQQWLPSKIF